MRVATAARAALLTPHTSGRYDTRRQLAWNTRQSQSNCNTGRRPNTHQTAHNTSLADNPCGPLMGRGATHSRLILMPLRRCPWTGVGTRARPRLGTVWRQVPSSVMFCSQTINVCRLARLSLLSEVGTIGRHMMGSKG